MAADPLTVSIPVQKQIAEPDPELTDSDCLPCSRLFNGPRVMPPERSLLLSFAVLSLILASVGLCGVPDARFHYLLLERSGRFEPLAVPRRGRRTALTFPLFPPPQKN